MKTRRYLQLTAIALVLVFAGMTQAQTTFTPDATALTVGPADRVSGFPISVADDGGTILGLCLDPVNCVFDPAIPGNAFSEQIGFGIEAFWFSAAATVTLPAGEARYEASVAALFDTLSGDPLAGATAPVTRISVRIPAGAAGTYRITHPYGEIVVDAAEGQRVDVKQEIPLGQAPNVGPFLTAANAPVGFLGDPGVAGTVTGGPNGNTIRIRGPGGIDVQTDQFFVMGQQLVTDPMTVAPVTADLVSGQTVSVAVTGGVGGMTAESSNAAVATATVSGRSLIVLGGTTPGTATITLTDSFSPVNTATVTVNVTAANAIGMLPGVVVLNGVLVTEPVSLVLNTTNLDGILPTEIVQEWLVVLIVHGATENLFFITSAGQAVPMAQVTNPGTVTFTFDHRVSTQFIGEGTLESAGFSPGDILMYGYAFSTTPVNSFLAAPNLVLENLVQVSMQ
jgi:hypothetical protein